MLERHPGPNLAIKLTRVTWAKSVSGYRTVVEGPATYPEVTDCAIMWRYLLQARFITKSLPHPEATESLSGSMILAFP